MEKYDVIVIGSGSGGLTVAYTARGFGKKVLLIDKDKPGGECTWSGCVPSKSLIHLAKEVSIVRKYNPDYKVAYESILEQVRGTREKVYLSETPEVLEKAGIHYVKGFAEFVDTMTVKVNEQLFRGAKIFITTGSSAFIPPIKGLEAIDYLTNETLFEQNKLKDTIIILGGGAIGIEIAMALNDLGIKVSIIEMLDRLLIKEEPDFSKEIASIMESKGIEIYVQSKAIEVRRNFENTQVDIDHNGHIKTIEAKGLIVAVGRTPNTQGLELEKAGVAYDRKGITVDEFLRTSNKHIYAIGDVASRYQFSHMAFFEGVQAVKNALLPIKKKMSYKHVPWCTYTSPELARTGLTEAEAREKYGSTVRVFTHPYDRIDRAKTEEAQRGMIKLVTDKKGRLLGASIIGERAGELICELQVIKTLGIKVSKLGNVIHPYPTYAEALSKLGRNVSLDLILNNPIVKVFRK